MGLLVNNWGAVISDFYSYKAVEITLWLFNPVLSEVLKNKIK